MDLISQLKSQLSIGARITGKQVKGIRCFSCPPPFAEIPFIGTIQAGFHESHCIWNYFVTCPRCNYENNLAKYAQDKNGNCTSIPCECA